MRWYVRVSGGFAEGRPDSAANLLGGVTLINVPEREDCAGMITKNAMSRRELDRRLAETGTEALSIFPVLD